MRVVILGATGRVGSLVLARADAAGHDVVVLSRRPLETAGAEVVVGELDDRVAVGRAIAGSDAVIAAVGARNNQAADADELENGMRIVTQAMIEQGVGRLLALSGAGIDVPGDTKPMLDRAVTRIVRVMARHVVAAKQREYAVFAATGLEWTALRPAIVTDGEARGYRLSRDLRPGARVTQQTSLRRWWTSSPLTTSSDRPRSSCQLDEWFASRVGFEPTTKGLKVPCSAAELPAHGRAYPTPSGQARS